MSGVMDCQPLPAQAAVQSAAIPLLSVAVNTPAITIGDPLTYTVTITIPANIEAKPEQPAASLLGDFRVRDVKEKERRDSAGNQVRVITYSLVTFELGKHTIPEFRIQYRCLGSPNKKWTTLTSKPIDITVNSVVTPGKNAVLQPLKPKVWIWPSWLWLVIGLFVVAGGAAAVVFMRHRRIEQAAIVPVPEPAYIIALRELEALAQARLPEQGLIEEYFKRLSGCVRRYLENRFHLRAPWMSTEEFMEAAKASSLLNGQQKNSLKAFLILCDLVKFARYGSSPKEADEAFIAAKNFVDQTRDTALKAPTEQNDVS